MSEKVLATVPNRYKSRCKVVGDLMADLPNEAKASKPLPQGTWIALMPGSKKAKLSVGVPFMLETADRIKKYLPNGIFKFF